MGLVCSLQIWPVGWNSVASISRCAKEDMYPPRSSHNYHYIARKHADSTLISPPSTVYRQPLLTPQIPSHAFHSFVTSFPAPTTPAASNCTTTPMNQNNTSKAQYSNLSTARVVLGKLSSSAEKTCFGGCCFRPGVAGPWCGGRYCSSTSGS